MIYRNETMRFTITSDALLGSDFESAYLAGVEAAGYCVRYKTIKRFKKIRYVVSVLKHS